MRVGIANPRWQGKRSRHYRRMRNPQLYVSDKRSSGESYDDDSDTAGDGDGSYINSNDDGIATYSSIEDDSSRWQW